MNETLFRQLLQQLPDDLWQRLLDGGGLSLVDDLDLQPGAAEAPDLIIRPDPVARRGRRDAANLAALKAEVMAGAGEILADYYRTHPLTLAGFNRQAQALLARYGMAAFAAVQGGLPERTLFVDGGELVAEAADSPRHRYGVFCELQRPLSAAVLDERVRRWLERGEAHQRYLGMNVCRYNC